MSWAGKILRVNLTAGTVKVEPLNMQSVSYTHLDVYKRQASCNRRTFEVIELFKDNAVAIQLMPKSNKRNLILPPILTL